MKQQGVYQIRNVVNGKFYVGSSKDIKNRHAAHRKLLRGNRHHCPHLQAAWNKYGEDCFKFEVIVLDVTLSHPCADVLVNYTHSSVSRKPKNIAKIYQKL